MGKAIFLAPGLIGFSLQITVREAKLSYRGHLLVENRNGLTADCALTKATGTVEPEAALEMLARERARKKGLSLTVGADRGYHTRAFVGAVRDMGSPPMWPERRDTTPSTAVPPPERATSKVNAGARW